MWIDRAKAYEKINDCHDHFRNAMAAYRSHLAVNQTDHARGELLRANASVAQGLVWNEILGQNDQIWIDRMIEVERAWRPLNNNIV